MAGREAAAPARGADRVRCVTCWGGAGSKPPAHHTLAAAPSGRASPAQLCAYLFLRRAHLFLSEGVL
jgi:hypothetical protein